MKHRTASRSSLFLMELILTILFFALSSAVCIQLFVKAHVISRDTSDKSAAVLQAQNAAELLKSGEGGFSRLKEYYPNSVSSGATELLVCFDQNWNPCPPEQAANQMTVSYLPAESGLRARITLCRESDPATPLYELEQYLHLPNRI